MSKYQQRMVVSVVGRTSSSAEDNGKDSGEDISREVFCGGEDISRVVSVVGSRTRAFASSSGTAQAFGVFHTTTICGDHDMHSPGI